MKVLFEKVIFGGLAELVDCAGFENRWRLKSSLKGSNPLPSSIFLKKNAGNRDIFRIEV